MAILASQESSASSEKQQTPLPLSDSHRHGLMTVATIGLISFVATTTLFSCVTFQLLRWKPSKHPREQSSGIRSYPQTPTSARDIGMFPDQRDEEKFKQERADAVNRSPFPILIYNVLLADMAGSLGFSLNAHWVARNSISPEDSSCWAQGWFLSNGDLASSIFLSIISVHTIMIVAFYYKPPRWVTQVCIGTAWAFVIFVSSIGIATTRNGLKRGGWYGLADTWCWISQDYDSYRFWTHYLWITASIILTVFLYTFLLYTLWRQKRSPRELPKSSLSTTTTDSSRVTSSLTGHHPAFFVVPVVYVVCSSPLALIRVVATAGIEVNNNVFYCMAGAMMACNGLCNTILWVTTILFSAPKDIEDAGLEDFEFSLASWGFGNVIYIEGLHAKDDEATAQRNKRGWWWWHAGGQQGWSNRPGILRRWQHKRGPDSLHGGGIPEDMNIHMNMVTAVVVEQASPRDSQRKHAAVN